MLYRYFGIAKAIWYYSNYLISNNNQLLYSIGANFKMEYFL